MIKRFIILLFFFIPVLCIQAQNTADDSLLNILEQMQQQSAQQAPTGEENYDDEEDDEEDDEDDAITDTFLNVHPISILPDTIASWKSKKEFAYVKNLDSLLKASQNEEEKKEPRNVNAEPPAFLSAIFNGPVLPLILWTMAGIFVLVILFQLAKSKGLFKSTISKGAQEEEIPVEEDVLEQNFDKLLQKAFAQGDYRLALRYQFLKTLQRLRDKELIEFAADKTNTRYIHEVPPRLQAEFASVILNYEYVWYGNFNINADQYAFLQKKYSTFNEKI